MAVIDDRGRLFGKVNFIDALVGVLVLGLIPLAYGAFLLFRVPAPKITSLSPTEVVENETMDSFLSRDLPTRVRVVGCSMIAAALTHAVMLALLGFSVHGVGWSIRLGFVVGGFVVALWPTALALAWRDRIGAS